MSSTERRSQYQTEYEMDLDQAVGGGIVAAAITGMNLLVNNLVELPKGVEEVLYVPAAGAAVYAAIYAVNAWSWRD